MSDPTSRSHRGRSPLVTGIVLIVIGGMLLALNLGWEIPITLRDYWPLFLIIPGVIAIVAPTRHITRSGGVWLVAWGTYCEICVTGVAGLGWFSAWPVFVIAYGIDILIGRGSLFGGCSKEQDQVSNE